MGYLVPTIRDLRPFPESAEAVAQGCTCAVARRRGQPMMTKTGSPVFAISGGCPVHDNPLRELPIWTAETQSRVVQREACTTMPAEYVAKAPDQVAPAELVQTLQRGQRPPIAERIRSLSKAARSDASRPVISSYQMATADSNSKAVSHQLEMAKLPSVKTLGDFDFAGAAVDEARIRQLQAGRFLDTARNVIFVGGTGSGKTHLAIAIATHAIDSGKRGRFYTAVDLVDQLEHNREIGQGGALAQQLTKVDFVVIDELGYLPLSKIGGALLFHLLGKLHEKTSVILTTNLRFSEWTSIFGDETMTKVLLDRLTHRCHIVETGVDSWRSRHRSELRVVG